VRSYLKSCRTLGRLPELACERVPVGVSRYSAWSRAGSARGVSQIPFHPAEVLRGTPTDTLLVSLLPQSYE